METKKNVFRKVACMVLACTMISGIAACGGDGPDESGIDITGKEILWIGNYDGAAGHKWLDKLIEEYETLHPDVKIFVENKKDEFTTTKLTSDMPYSDNDIYFLDHVMWYDIMNLTEDITDLITEKIYNDAGDFPQEGETATKSILDMMMPAYAEYMNNGTAENPQYYAVPCFYPISGIVYDADLFNEYKWFFDKDGKIGVRKDDPNVGPGPDGKFETTYDNGEPETWNDFNTLLTQIKMRGITPFTWSGQYIYQRQYFTKAVQANYEGAADYMLNFTLNGTDSSLGEITEETAYKLMNQEGYLASCIATRDLLSDTSNYSKNAFNDLTQSHTVAESEFVYSIETNRRIAMFLESSYWEPEAHLTFEEMAQFDANYGYGKRNFAYMTVPKFKGVEGIADSTNEKTTLYGDGSTKCVVINKASEQMELAKDFFRFIHTRSANATFTIHSNTFRPFTYSLNDAEYAQLTPFMKSVVDRVTDTENVEVVVGEQYNKAFANYDIEGFATKAKFGTKVYYELFDAFRAQTGSFSANDLWTAMKNATNEGNWKVGK